GGLGGGASTAGGTAGGTGGTTGGAVNPVYIVNDQRDTSLGNRLPITVGTSSGGLNNFTSNLAIPFIQNAGSTSTLISPTNAVAGTGATFGIFFLSDLEVFLFLSAAQGVVRTNILQAPKVTTFNGAPGTIFNPETIYYVQELVPIVGPGSVAFFPSVAQFPNGVTLSVTPVVS